MAENINVAVCVQAALGHMVGAFYIDQVVNKAAAIGAAAGCAINDDWRREARVVVTVRSHHLRHPKSYRHTQTTVEGVPQKLYAKTRAEADELMAAGVVKLKKLLSLNDIDPP